MVAQTTSPYLGQPLDLPARPFLKWVGGKDQLLPSLELHLPAQFARYHEPFLGGGAFFFRLRSLGRLGSGAVLSDINAELISCYAVVRDQVEALIPQLEALQPFANDRAFFSEIRDWDRQPDFADRPAVERAARLIYLNRTGYNGLYRLNCSGYFNAPFGRHANPRVANPEALRAASAALQGVTLVAGDFAAVLERAQAGDLVYFDPPYVPVSATAAFTSYAAGGFDTAAQRRLAAAFATLAERGCQVMLSNSATSDAATLVAPLGRVETVTARRLINSRADQRGGVGELIVTSY